MSGHSKAPLKRTRLTNTVIAGFACTPGTNCGEKARFALLFDSEFPRLAVRVTLAGAKSFVFEGHRDGRLVSVTIGDVKTWGIDDARARARQLQSMLDQGIDPREEARERKAKAEEKKREEAAAAKAELQRQKYSLKALCEAYVAHLRARGKNKSANDCLSAFRCHLFPHEYANLPAADIKPIQIAEIVRATAEKSARTAGVLRAYMCAAYNASIKAPLSVKVKSDLIPFNLVSNPVSPVENLKSQAGTRHLSPAELKKYIKAIGDSAPDNALRLALLLGGQRMAQLVRAKVGDYVPDSGTLRLFDAKGKRQVARVHLLPAGPKAKAMIEALIADRPPEALLINISPRTVGDYLATLRETHKLGDFDLKDIRRTCETMLASMGISKDIRAQLLSHGISGVQDTNYDQWDYISEKRAALIAWENRLEEIESGQLKPSNVVSLRA